MLNTKLVLIYILLVLLSLPPKEERSLTFNIIKHSRLASTGVIFRRNTYKYYSYSLYVAAREVT